MKLFQRNIRIVFGVVFVLSLLWFAANRLSEIRDNKRLEEQQNILQQNLQMTT